MSISESRNLTQVGIVHAIIINHASCWPTPTRTIHRVKSAVQLVTSVMICFIQSKMIVLCVESQSFVCIISTVFQHLWLHLGYSQNTPPMWIIVPWQAKFNKLSMMLSFPIHLYPVIQSNLPYSTWIFWLPLLISQLHSTSINRSASKSIMYDKAFELHFYSYLLIGCIISSTLTVKYPSTPLHQNQTWT